MLFRSAASNICLRQQSGQTQSQAIILIDDNDEVQPISSGSGTTRPPQVGVPWEAAPVYRKLPEMNGVPRASPVPATYNQGPFRQMGAGFESTHPAIVPRTMVSHPNRPVDSLLRAQSHAPTRIIPLNIPLPSFHQVPVSKTRTKSVTVQKTSLARRPHQQGPQASGSPARKRMRMNDGPFYRLPPGDTRQESDTAQQNVRPSPAPPKPRQVTSASIESPKYRSEERRVGKECPV